jgi:hypothetical protein
VRAKVTKLAARKCLLDFQRFQVQAILLRKRERESERESERKRVRK